MNILWLGNTRFHNYSTEELTSFYREVGNTNCDVILHTGNISTGNNDKVLPDCHKHLLHLYKAINKPILFVHGAEDYYCSSINTILLKGIIMSNNHKNIIYLAGGGIFSNFVTRKYKTLIVGVDLCFNDDNKHNAIETIWEMQQIFKDYNNVQYIDHYVDQLVNKELIELERSVKECFYYAPDVNKIIIAANTSKIRGDKLNKLVKKLKSKYKNVDFLIISDNPYVGLSYEHLTV